MIITSTEDKNTMILNIWNGNVNVCRNFAMKVCYYQHESTWKTLKVLLKKLDTLLLHYVIYPETNNFSEYIARELLRTISNLYDNEHIKNPENQQNSISTLLWMLSSLRTLKMRYELGISCLINTYIFIQLLYELQIDDKVIFLEEGGLEEFIENRYRIFDVYSLQCKNSVDKILFDDLVCKFKISANNLLNKQYNKNTILWIVKLQNYSEYKRYTSIKDTFTSLRWT